MSILRKFLFPFALLHGLIMLIRNLLYNLRVLKYESYSFPVICVGNLSVGGTGKTPMIEYLLELLLPDYKVATLSRGYGRNTKGYRLVNMAESATNVGDEPLQFKNKFKEALVAVDENRRRGIVKLRDEHHPDLILLDDAYQHRKVKAGLNVLLTRYNDLYEDDVMLPTGNLREPAIGAGRAKVIVVTKCPENLSIEDQESIRIKLKPRNYQRLFFSYIRYSDHVFNGSKKILLRDLVDKEITLVTGIANPASLCEHLRTSGISYKHLNFPDHHNFSSEEINKIDLSKLVITTEKDFMRLKGEVALDKLFYLPIKMKFIQNTDGFNKQISSYIINEK
ncbi:lipid-A-disaccharide kinase [Gillisia sp. Hel_I_86]|uniref:tetraacyldisaccharide 4'-kinase n=1 Tax=Gillisia sp. Hel_I_86 TaxID=1249981 RepID=UPI00119C322E|nr:tetraacyldisaccharide 4'-kinase [Gillisia sp. Hel_I_86]TVZ27386.1 lipid-A-disaccharide kinase [Gillisia sp. Hel_I_86]